MAAPWRPYVGVGRWVCHSCGPRRSRVSPTPRAAPRSRHSRSPHSHSSHPCSPHQRKPQRQQCRRAIAAAVVPSPPWAILQLLAALALPPSAPPFARPNHRRRQKVEPNWAFPPSRRHGRRAWPARGRSSSASLLPSFSPFCVRLHLAELALAFSATTVACVGRPSCASAAMHVGELNAELI
jgi:hypothetical protein